MNNLLNITFLGILFGTFGTTIGGILGVYIKNISNKLLSFILEFAAGLMTVIICFDLIPEAMHISNIFNILIGITCGIITMIASDQILRNKYKGKARSKGNTNSLLRTGVIVGIGLAIHNFPEGLAIGSGFTSSLALGYSLAIAILFHDIPEGIAMSVPLKNGGMKSSKVIIYTILSGLTTGLGAFIGGIVGNISINLIAFCLSFAAGAMLYIVSRRINT